LELVRKEQDAYREKQAENARKRHSRGRATAQPPQDSGSGLADVWQVPEACPSSAPASVPLDRKDQDHRADARAAYPVLLKLAHQALREDPSYPKDRLKELAGEHKIPYDAEVVTKALDAAEHTQPKAVNS
jgi:hypothetical protein